MTSRSGVDHTAGMKAWVAQRLNALEREDLCGFVFKSRSPSCGMRQIDVYPPAGGVPSSTGVGIFARAFMERFPLLPVEDEDRLNDLALRENFIERLFVVARRPPPRFLCDVMLGRLARWLRALGHNAAYDHAADDPALLRRAVRERRILVTRDTRLAATLRGPRAVLLHANDTPGQLRELVKALSIARHPGLLTRCIVCNTGLCKATADQIEERVPEYIRSTQQVFRTCPGCERVYWAGTHRQGILAALESALPGVTGHGPDAEPGDLTSR